MFVARTELLGAGQLFDTAAIAIMTTSGSIAVTPTIVGNVILAVVTSAASYVAPSYVRVGAYNMTHLFTIGNDTGSGGATTHGAQDWYILKNSGLTGAQSVTTSFASSPGYAALGVVSYKANSLVLNVPAGAGTGLLSSAYGQSGTPSLSASGAYGNGLVVCAFSAYTSSATATLGSFNQYQRANSGASRAILLLGDARGQGAPTTFSAAMSAGSPYWAAASGLLI